MLEWILFGTWTSALTNFNRFIFHQWNRKWDGLSLVLSISGSPELQQPFLSSWFMMITVEFFSTIDSKCDCIKYGISNKFWVSIALKQHKIDNNNLMVSPNFIATILKKNRYRSTCTQLFFSVCFYLFFCFNSFRFCVKFKLHSQ